MSDRDSELDKILNPLRDTQPDQLMLQRMQNTVSYELKKSNEVNNKKRSYFELVAAVIIGFLIGATLMKIAEEKQHEQFPLEANLDATIETVYTNY